MSRTVLTLRINRRAIGAVVLGADALDFADGRHLTSKLGKTTEAARRFVEYVLGMTKPTLVVVDAPPAVVDTTTARVVEAVRALAQQRGVEVLSVGKTEILAAYGVHGVRSRRELRELVRHYWDFGHLRGQVAPFVIDAAAAALYVECRLALERLIA